MKRRIPGTPVTFTDLQMSMFNRYHPRAIRGKGECPEAEKPERHQAEVGRDFLDDPDR